MSLYDYKRAIELRNSDEPFYALIMAAMLKADSDNAAELRLAFPHVWDELDVRYHAPGGMTPAEAAEHDDKMRAAITGAVNAHPRGDS